MHKGFEQYRLRLFRKSVAVRHCVEWRHAISNFRRAGRIKVLLEGRKAGNTAAQFKRKKSG